MYAPPVSAKMMIVGSASIQCRRFISSKMLKPSGSGMTISGKRAERLLRYAWRAARATFPLEASMISKSASSVLARIARFSSASSASSVFFVSYGLLARPGRWLGAASNLAAPPHGAIWFLYSYYIAITTKDRTYSLISLYYFNILSVPLRQNRRRKKN